MVGMLTAGITISMFFLGSVADKKGVRKTLLMAFGFLLVGRIIWSAAPMVFPETGIWSNMHLMTMAGIVLVVIGYGMYQPAAYAGVRKFTNPKTAAMGYAMLYALMNLGGWLPSFFSGVRESVGITGAFWVYTGITAVALLATLLILTRKVEERPSPGRARPSRRRREPPPPRRRPASPEAETPVAPIHLAGWLPLHPAGSSCWPWPAWRPT